jgi:hypothetical protein
MNSSAARAFAAVLRHEWERFEHAVADPMRVQRSLLCRILRHNRQAAYGEQYAFADIRDLETFRQNVPVMTGEALAVLAERMANGETNLLAADQPVAFNQTSGTTGKPKLIPLARRSQQNAFRSLRRWLYRTISDHPESMRDAVLVPTGPAIEGLTPSGIPVSSASAMFCRGLPAQMRRQSVLPPGVSEVADYECRYYLMGRFALARDVSFLATPNPTTLLQIAAVADQHRDDIMRAIHDGTLGTRDMVERIPAGLRRCFLAFLAPDRPRARALERACAGRGALLPQDCWKRFPMIGCWLGGTVGVQADKLASAFGSDLCTRDLGYLASEGWFSIPMQDGDSAGVLEICGNVFEFIPDDDSAPVGATTLRCDELKEGGRYRVLVTNWNGLYRYEMGDVVEVRGFYRRTPRIAFVRKSGDMLNITGEKLHANHLLAALAKLRVVCHPAPVAWRAVPDLLRNRYQILLCFRSDPAPEYLRATLIPLLDRSLCEVNIEYAHKRESGRLHPPCIHLMTEAWERDVRKQGCTAGRGDLQYKWKVTAAELSAEDVRNIRCTIEL